MILYQWNIQDRNLREFHVYMRNKQVMLIEHPFYLNIVF